MRARNLQLGFLLLLAVLIGSYSLVGPLAAAQDPQVIYDDQRGWVSMFHRYHDPSTLVGDDIYTQLAESVAPVGYRWLLRSLSRTVAPVPLTKWMGVGLGVVAMFGLGQAAARWFGVEMGIAVFTLSAHASIFLDRGLGGLHRSFAYPVIALAVWACAAERVGVAAWLVVAAAFFYPPAAPLLATVVAVRLLALRPLSSAPVRRAWGHCLVAALVAVVALWWWTRGLAPYGPAITLDAAAASPMWQRGIGRYHFLPFPPPHEEVITAIMQAFRATQAPLPAASAWLAAGIIACGFWCAPSRFDRPARTIWLFATSGLVWYGLARLLAFRLNFPVRNLTVMLPVAGLLLWAWSWHHLRLRFVPHASPFWAALGAVLVGIVVGGPTRWQHPDPAINTLPLNALTHAVRTLPGGAVLSGPPQLVDTLTATAHRRIFVSWELLLPARPRLMERLLPRYDVHYQAYYAATVEPFRALHAEGADYLVVDRADFTPVALERARLFEPVTSRIQHYIHRNTARDFWVTRPPRSVIVFDDGRHLLLDLAAIARLDANAQPRGPAS